jgi:hypothetical protein
MLELANAKWIGAIIIVVDLLALVSIWRSALHSVKAKLVWTVIVAILPVLGALAWFPLGREKRRATDAVERRARMEE